VGEWGVEWGEWGRGKGGDSTREEEEEEMLRIKE